MSEKKILSFLEQAKSDYELSLALSKRFFVRKKRFRELGTHHGLAVYFEQNFRCNPVWLHLYRFRPVSIEEGLAARNLWFPVGCTEGFQSRLALINLAIDYYRTVKESEVAFLPVCDSALLVHAFVSVENGSTDASAVKIYNHIRLYYDEYLDRGSEEG